MGVARLIGIVLALAVAAVQAAPPIEPVVVRLEVVDPASRQFVANGVTWALSSTAAIRMPGKKHAALGDLSPGMHVRLDLDSAVDGKLPVVRTVTVIPN